VPVDALDQPSSDPLPVDVPVAVAVPVPPFESQPSAASIFVSGASTNSAPDPTAAAGAPQLWAATPAAAAGSLLLGGGPVPATLASSTGAGSLLDGASGAALLPFPTGGARSATKLQAAEADEDEETVLGQLAAAQRRRLLQVSCALAALAALLLAAYRLWKWRASRGSKEYSREGATYSNLRGEPGERSWNSPGGSGPGAGWGWGWGGGARAREDASLLVPTACDLDIADNMSQAGSTVGEHLDNWDDFDLDDDDDAWGATAPVRAANEEEASEGEGPGEPGGTPARAQLLV